MQKKFYLPLFFTIGALLFSPLSHLTILNAQTIGDANTLRESLAKQNVPKENVPLRNIPWESSMDASWLDPSKPIIALTFDDGPVWSGNSASNILDTLEAYNAHATFFYCGINISDTTKSEIQRSYALGNEIGNHTTDHLDLTAFDASKISDEVNSTATLLSDITGLDNFLVRSPYCSSNETIFETIPVPLISACVDSKDYMGVNVQDIIDKVLTQADDGAIILMHETLATTGEAVKTIVPELIKRGYQLASVSEMMKAKGVTLTSGNMYTHAPIPSNVTTVLEGVALNYKVTSEWPGNYMGEMSITNTSQKPISNWSLDFDFADTFSAVYGATLKDSVSGHSTITSSQQNQSIQPGQTITFSFCVNASKSIPKFPSNFTLTSGDGTIISTPSDNTSNKDDINTPSTGETSDKDDPTTTPSKEDTPNKDDATNTPSKEDTPNKDEPSINSPLTVSSKLDSWETGYTCAMTVNNPSDIAVNTWTVKLLKADFQITNSWNCTITEDGDYLLITPAPYNANLSANSSVQFGFEGTGTVNPDFVATVE